MEFVTKALIRIGRYYNVTYVKWILDEGTYLVRVCRTTAILGCILLTCQPVAQGRPSGHRAQPRRKKIAVALDRVTLIRTATVLDRMMMS